MKRRKLCKCIYSATLWRSVLQRLVLKFTKSRLFNWWAGKECVKELGNLLQALTVHAKCESCLWGNRTGICRIVILSGAAWRHRQWKARKMQCKKLRTKSWISLRTSGKEVNWLVLVNLASYLPCRVIKTKFGFVAIGVISWIRIIG